MEPISLENESNALENESKYKTYQRQYHKDHKTEKKKYNKNFTRAHPDYFKSYYLKHKEEILKQQKEYRSSITG